jgi:phage baseplate assembly protein V
MDVESRSVFPKTKIGRDHQLRDAFRHGKVIDRKLDSKKGPLVRVQFLDKQGLISYWLPIKQPGSRKTMHFYCPKIGDDVNVNFLANGVEHGFVDGSFFNKSNPPPEGVDIDTRHFKSEDGSVIEYRESDSTFNLDASGATGGRMRTGGGGLVKVTAATIMLTAPEILITGNIQHTGLINTTGVHTDVNGIHMGGMARSGGELEELRREIAALKERIAVLEQR